MRRFRSFMSAWFTVMRISHVENLRIFPEFAQVLEGLQEGLLNRVLGIFPIMRDVFSNSKEFAIVSLYELLRKQHTSPFLLAWTRSRSSLATAFPASCANSAVIFVQGALKKPAL